MDTRGQEGFSREAIGELYRQAEEAVPGYLFLASAGREELRFVRFDPCSRGPESTSIRFDGECPDAWRVDVEAIGTGKTARAAVEDLLASIEKIFGSNYSSVQPYTHDDLLLALLSIEEKADAILKRSVSTSTPFAQGRAKGLEEAVDIIRALFDRRSDTVSTTAVEEAKS